jgi:murein DD-endopeptidase MepM/ murein hydrolase activator NlpD
MGAEETPPQAGISGNPVDLPKPAPAPREPEQPSAMSTAPGPTAALERPPSGARDMFLWPVRGHVIEGFGGGPGGTHNDGLNIAAPHGSAIEATDGGIVAYTGNELRGYGNLILIKHPGGWISAYAHCDLILVKTGQRVARGQVIARVGSTGNVSEPQLHFELRRGKKPVDPREYLAPPSTAATRDAHPS